MVRNECCLAPYRSPYWNIFLKLWQLLGWRAWLNTRVSSQKCSNFRPNAMVISISHSRQWDTTYRSQLIHWWNCSWRLSWFCHCCPQSNWGFLCHRSLQWLQLKNVIPPIPCWCLFYPQQPLPRSWWKRKLPWSSKKHQQWRLDCLTLRFRLSPFTRATVPSWSDLITYTFIGTSKDHLEIRRPIFPVPHLTSFALL